MNATATASNGETGDALRLQHVLSKYAEGKSSLAEMSAEVRKLQPKPQPQTWRNRIICFLASILIAMLVPSTASQQREDT